MVTMEPLSSEKAMKSSGMRRWNTRCVPADECLEPSHGTVVEAHDGLVLEPQLLALGGPPQRPLSARRSSTPRRSAGSNTSTRALPAVFARYIAVSASRSSMSAVVSGC